MLLIWLRIRVTDLYLLWQGDAGSIQLARALQQHTNVKLSELDLGYNEIKDDGACAIAQVSGSTFSIACCVQCGVTNASSSDDCEAITLAVNQNQLYFQVWMNRRLVYLQALKNNPEGAPRELKISANRLTRFGQIALQEALDVV